MGYQYILFDLDGTLTHSHPGIYGCFRYALEQMGEPTPKEEFLKQCVGPSLMYSFTTFFKMSEERAREATAKYRERYSVVGWQENEPIDGAIECLKTLKESGFVLAMATSKPKIYADKIADKFGFTPYLTARVGCGMDGSLPTKAAVIREALRQLGAKPEACLMIGDTKYDAEGAKEVGVDCALLRVGYAQEGEIEACKPGYIFDGFGDLTDFLLKK